MSGARPSAGELNNKTEAGLYDDGYLRVEHDNFYAACKGKPLRLRRTEFLILSCLVRSVERIVTTQQIWDYAWPKKKPLNVLSLHVYMHRLRGQLLPFGLRIDNMVNVGYRLLLDVDETADSNTPNDKSVLVKDAPPKRLKQPRLSRRTQNA